MKKKLFRTTLTINAGLILCLSALVIIGIASRTEEMVDDDYSSTEPNVSTIQVTHVDFAKCRNDDDQVAPVDWYWYVLTIKNTNSDYWAQGEGIFRILNSKGETIGGFYFNNLILAAESQSWFLPEDMLQRRQVSSIEGDISSYELTITGLAWNRIVESSENHQWESYIESHTITNGENPRHLLSIHISNIGDTVMYRTKIFAAIYDSNDQLIDIAWSEESGDLASGTQLNPGESKTLSVNSIAQTGICLGPIDNEEYHIKYWVDVLSATGQPLQTFHTETISALDTNTLP